MFRSLCRLRADRSGAATIEYGLIAAVGMTGQKLIEAFSSLLNWF